MTIISAVIATLKLLYFYLRVFDSAYDTKVVNLFQRKMMTSSLLSNTSRPTN